MHIILGLLGSLVTILWLLHRLAEMGITLGGLNPWLWRRRRRWKKQYEANPIYSVTNPLEVTALLMVYLAKIDGEISLDEKQKILELFELEFKYSKVKAAELFSSSAHLLGRGDEIKDNLKSVMKPSLPHFSQEQIQSAFKMLQAVCHTGEITDVQTAFIAELESILQKNDDTHQTWQ